MKRSLGLELNFHQQGVLQTLINMSTNFHNYDNIEYRCLKVFDTNHTNIDRTLYFISEYNFTIGAGKLIWFSITGSGE